MCEPVSATTAGIMIAGVVLAAAGTGVSMYQAKQSADAQAEAAQNQANYQAQVAKNNAAYAEQNAQMQEQIAQTEAARIRTQGRKVLGSQTAAIGKSGITMDGSAGDVLDESLMNYETDALTALWEGDVKARNSRIQAGSYRDSGNLAIAEGANTAAFAKAKGNNAMVEGGFSLAQTGLGAYSSYSSAPRFSSSSGGYDGYTNVGGDMVGYRKATAA